MYISMNKVERGKTAIIGTHPRLKKVLRLINKIAQVNVPVLISGESGTGKELVAHTIHERSPRANKPFIAINVGALSKELIESELFGYEKGAFTNATQQKKGKFELAHEGTLFLDEISTMSPKSQVSLLRVLETKQFQRVGGIHIIKTDIRILAASNEDLKLLIKKDKFRKDLYYRLNAFHIKLPPLRERGKDIELLTNYFIKLYNAVFHKNVLGLTNEVLEIFYRYSWPGNIRELENVIKRAIILSEQELITPALLPNEIKEGCAYQENIIIRIGTTFEEAEKELLIKTLQKVNGNKQEAAHILGISRKSMYNKINKYRLTYHKEA